MLAWKRGVERSDGGGSQPAGVRVHSPDGCGSVRQVDGDLSGEIGEECSKYGEVVKVTRTSTPLPRAHALVSTPPLHCQPNPRVPSRSPKPPQTEPDLRCAGDYP